MPPFAPQPASALALVEFGPPPGRVETIPPRPRGADAWVNGEWVLRNGRWFWLLGRWVKAPQGARYRPWVFLRGSDGTAYYAPSYWVDSAGEPIAYPPALAYAGASAMAVISPDGEPEETGQVIKTDAPSPLRPRDEGHPE